jgi:hypothetical protein
VSYDPSQPYEQIPYGDSYTQQPPSQASELPPFTQYPSYDHPSFYTQQAHQPYSMPPMPPPLPPVPPYTQPPQQQKKSRKWLWITLGIIGGIVLLSCVGCAIVLGTSFNSVKQILGPAFIPGEYYQYIKMQRYDKAYALLDSHASITINGKTIPNDQQSFTNAALQVDHSLGTVTNISVQPNENNLDQITVLVTRQKGNPYAVHLTFVQTGGSTRIASIDGI